MNVCKRCDKEFLPTKGLANYCSFTCLNTRKILIENINWEIIQKDYDDGLTRIELCEKYDSLNNSKLQKAKKLGFFKPRTISESRKISKKSFVKHTKETKDNLSKIRKEFLKNNPDKHPWKRKDKLLSIPCENLKKVLDNNKIQYIEEYSPSNEKHYSIDVFLPNYNLALEVNGNQHYNNDGTLKKYYQDRHNFIKKLGFEIHEFHYSLFFNEIKIKDLLSNLLENKDIFDFDYEKYLLEKINLEKKDFFCDCGNKIGKDNGKCVKCSRLSKRKVERPKLEVLLQDVKNFGYSETGRKYGVSDNSIRKWIKQYKN